MPTTPIVARNRAKSSGSNVRIFNSSLFMDSEELLDDDGFPLSDY